MEKLCRITHGEGLSVLAFPEEFQAIAIGQGSEGEFHSGEKILVYYLIE